MWKQIRICLLLFVMLSVLTGLVYPALITGIAQVLFRDQADGSLIRQNGVIIGSRLIGQEFEDPKYFWGRISATSPAYNASATSGSNLGPLNPKLKDTVVARITQLHNADPGTSLPIPVDLVPASASGLDPHISIA